MKTNFITKTKIFLLALIITLNANIVFSQVDGTNFDFNAYTPGNYAGWRGYKGTNATSSPYTTPTLGTWTGYNNPADVLLGSTPCFVINSNVNETDPLVPALKKIPIGYTRSTRINCNPVGTSPNANANMLTYDLDVTNQNCLLTFNFAMVLNDAGHDGWDNPFFMIKVMSLDPITEQETGLVETCAT